MDRLLRSAYNDAWTPEAYAHVVQLLTRPAPWGIDFRVCETPLFLSESFTRQIEEASRDLLRQIQTPEFRSYSANAVPPGQDVPNLDDHPCFVQIDFALTEDGPKLIELQGFASLFAYQVMLDRAYREAGLVPDNVSCYFGGMAEEEYIERLGRLILGGEDPRHVALVEIHPERQHTRVDFACTQELFGVPIVNLTELRRDGKTLFYERDGQRHEVRRIYNRVIFDELERYPDLELAFRLTDDVDVTWAAHPNWFHRLSKHSLPFLKGPSVPESFRLSELASLPEDLENYVLKPLYSYAGAGVVLDVTPEHLADAEDPQNTLLQRKVTYADAIQTPEGPRRAEIRVMVLWEDEPVLANTLVRMSRSGLMSAGKNKTEAWVGATTGYHRVP